MGLDITAYKTIEARPEMTADEAERRCWEAGYATLRVNPDFGQHADGIKTGQYQVSPYAQRDDGKTRIDFRAGSYSGYNWWREELAKLVGTTPDGLWTARATAAAKSTPFYELVCFSDCEGIIGPVTSAKLAEDFSAWSRRAAAHAKKMAEGGDFWLEQYKRWQAAFKLAAGKGAVVFH